MGNISGKKKKAQRHHNVFDYYDFGEQSGEREKKEQQQIRPATGSSGIGQRGMIITKKEEDDIKRLAAIRGQQNFLDIDRLYQLLMCGQRKEYGLSSNDTISLALRSSQNLKRVYDFTHQFEAPGVLGDYGFSGKHLNLAKEFCSTHSQESPLGHCWDAHVKHWKDKVTAWHDHEATKSRDAIYWPQGWRAKCTDASEQRCLKAKPNERIECELLYVLSCKSNSCIIQYQVGIDFFKIEQNNRGDISQICHQRDSGIKKFFLTAPSKPGLYMIRGKPSYHYSFRQAAETWPKNYDNCSKWLRYFIAWLQVDPQARPSTPGPMVYFTRR